MCGSKDGSDRYEGGHMVFLPGNDASKKAQAASVQTMPRFFS
jgi:hypothetical protein